MRLLNYRPPTRFVDHMHSEHEVKHEPEVILAVSVSSFDFYVWTWWHKRTSDIIFKSPENYSDGEKLLTVLSYCWSISYCKYFGFRC